MLIAQRYGGTSIGDLERIKTVTLRAIESVEAGNELVAIVSAMSEVIDSLIKQAEYFSKNPNGANMDMLLGDGERATSALLLIALNELRYKVVSFSGREAGIITSSIFAKARIEHIDTSAVKTALKEGKVVIIASFQGVDEEGSVTALGRGGSDSGAVVVAGALDTDLCRIYTDVDGVYTTDPRMEPRTKKLDEVSYEEMLELTGLGAKVLQNRFVELAKKLNINLATRSSFNSNEGTMVTKENGVEQALVSGIALDKNQARIALGNIEDRPGIAVRIFSSLARTDINVDMIIQNVDTSGATNSGFAMSEGRLSQTKNMMKKALGDQVSLESDSVMVKVSVVGVDMESHSDVVSAALKALTDEGINIGIISTSEIKISMIVHEKYGELAIHASYEVYGLDK